jgi:hypothetical protein
MLPISGVSKRTDTKEGKLFRVIMEHEDIFFCFWPFVNAQELLEVTTKLPVKLNDRITLVYTVSVASDFFAVSE